MRLQHKKPKDENCKMSYWQGEYSCHVCDKKTKFKQNLKKHIQEEHGETELKNYFALEKNNDVTLKETSGVCPHCGEVLYFY